MKIVVLITYYSFPYKYIFSWYRENVHKKFIILFTYKTDEKIFFSDINHI